MNHPDYNLTLGGGAQSSPYPHQNCSKVLHLCLLEQISEFKLIKLRLWIDLGDIIWICGLRPQIHIITPKSIHNLNLINLNSLISSAGRGRYPLVVPLLKFLEEKKVVG